MTSRGRWARNVAVVAWLLCASGCTAAGSPTQTSGTVADPSSDTVQVEERNITSVVVVDGTVVASPTFVVPAPAAGRLGYRSGLKRGAAIAKGEQVARVGATHVVAPAAGEVAAVLRSEGVSVAAQLPLLSVRYSGFGVLTTIPLTDQYRLHDGAISAKVNVESGPSGIDCQVVRPAAAASGEAGVRALCLLALDEPVVEGLVAKIGLYTGHRDAVPSIPLDAVSGRAGEGTVTRVLADGGTEQASVQLGVTDGAYIEVTGGLKVGDRILAQAPGIK